MDNEELTGGYFSRNYFQSDTLVEDDDRMRFRLAAYLDDYCEKSGDFGKFIERELGIAVTQTGPYGKFVVWKKVFENCSTKDLLDIITAIAKFRPQRVDRSGRIPVTYNFITFVGRLFREQKVAYRIDDKGGVHPFVDQAFSSEFGELIAKFSDPRLKAASQHLTVAEQSLLTIEFDGRQAVRAIFDTIENVFKLLCKGSPQLNNASIRSKLKPLLVDRHQTEEHEARAVGKLIDGLTSWVEAGHNYRHEPGKNDPPSPSKIFAVQYVSQGLGYARWLGEHYISINNSGEQ